MKTCPSCKKTIKKNTDDQKWLPFCCERCQLIDFGSWMDGSHSIPGEETVIIPDDDMMSH